MGVDSQRQGRERLIAAGILRPASRPFDPTGWKPVDLPDVESSEVVLAQVRSRR